MTPVSDVRVQNSSWSEREQKKRERKHGKGSSLLCQEGTREKKSEEERETGESINSDAQLPLVIWTTTPSHRHKIDSERGGYSYHVTRLYPFRLTYNLPASFAQPMFPLNISTTTSYRFPDVYTTTLSISICVVK